MVYVEVEGEKTFDKVVPQVESALQQNGHTVSVLGVHGDVKKLLAGIGRRAPDLIFKSPRSYRR
jgi:uncharacterized protein (DUF302 family)